MNFSTLKKNHFENNFKPHNQKDYLAKVHISLPLDIVTKLHNIFKKVTFAHKTLGKFQCK